MLLVSLSLFGILPPIEATLLSLSGGNTPMTKMRGLFGKQSFFSTLTLGILWGFLPCGLVFAMLILAARAESLFGGALTMLAFGLGTVPTLLGFGLAANLVSPKLRGSLQSVAAVLLMLFAVQTILRGLSVAGYIPPMIIGPVMLW
jgi:sulfite exporter TauE/SafE